MNLLKCCAFITMIFSVFPIFSQIENPFRSIGKKGEIVTLSNGKYQEVHPYDSLQKIGSVIVNINTGMIYKIIDTVTMYSEATLDPTIISRWYSPDPIQHPHQSPYTFVNNNPIIFNDPDGRSGELTIKKDANGNETYVIKANLHFYTGDASLQKFDHNKVTTEMMTQFNSQNVSLTVDGKTLPVKLELTSDLVYNEAFDKISFDPNKPNAWEDNATAVGFLPGNNTDHNDLVNNYIRIENLPLEDASTNNVGRQIGLWNVNQLTTGSTTAIHEFLHSLGVLHPVTYNDADKLEVDAKPGDPIPASYPRGTVYKGSLVEINPDDRVVTNLETSQFWVSTQTIYENTNQIIGNTGYSGQILIDNSGTCDYIEKK